MPKKRITKASPAVDLPGLTTKKKLELKHLKISNILSPSRTSLLSSLPAISQAYARFRPQPMRRQMADNAARLLLRGLPPRATIVGSLRRRKEIVGDLDFLLEKVKTKKPTGVDLLETAAKSAGGNVLAVFSSGPNKTSGILSVSIKGKTINVAVDLFFASKSDWGSALVHFTGGREFNIHIRAAAKRKGKSLSQHGLRDLSTKKIQRFRSEKALMRAVGYRWHEPKER